MQSLKKKSHKPNSESFLIPQLMNDFYNIHAEKYFWDTVNLDPTTFLIPLLAHLPQGSTVLDIGCGSGRDLHYLKARGFLPIGLERATNLAVLARKHSGCIVFEGDFTTYDFSKHRVNAVVSIGSMVHLPQKELRAVLASILSALTPGGLFLLTIKEGDGIVQGKDGRLFTLWQTDRIEIIFSSLHLAILDFSRQISHLRSEDIWLSYLLQNPNNISNE